MSKKITQRQRVLQYIKEHGSITRMKAAQMIGCFELASRIGELEAEGYKFKRSIVKSLNRYGDKIHYMKYELDEEE